MADPNDLEINYTDEEGVFTCNCSECETELILYGKDMEPRPLNCDSVDGGCFETHHLTPMARRTILDYKVLRCGSCGEEFRLPHNYNFPHKVGRIGRIKSILALYNSPDTLEGVYGVIDQLFSNVDMKIVDVVLSAYLTVVNDSDPLWIYLVGRSGGWKSEILSSLVGMENVKVLIDVSKPAFVSAYRGKNGNKVADIGSELQGKHTLLLFPDLASLSSKDPREKRDLFAMFRTLYDGKLFRSTGTGEQMEYNDCHVNVLGGITPTAMREDLQAQVQLGTRELCFGTTEENSYVTDIEKMRQAISGQIPKKEIRRILKQTIQGFLLKKIRRFPVGETFNNDIDLPEELKEWLYRQCVLLSYMRASQDIDWYSGEVKGDTDREVPTRLVIQLRLLYQGLKSLDPDYSDDRFKSIVRNIVRNSGNKVRYDIYHFLKTVHQQNPDLEYSISDIQKELAIGRKIVLSQCGVLVNLGIISIRHELENHFGKEVLVGHYKYLDPTVQLNLEQVVLTC